MKIEFLLDENLPFALMDFLEKKGHRVNHLKKMGKSGIKNGEVYKIAEQNTILHGMLPQRTIISKLTIGGYVYGFSCFNRGI